jgi:hypothetical protein
MQGNTLRTNGIEDTEDQTCAQCGATFPTDYALVEHQAAVHHRVSGAVDRDVRSPSEPNADIGESGRTGARGAAEPESD